MRVLPAGEGLEATEEAGAEFDERLEIGDDLVVFEGSAQIVGVVGSHARDDTTGSLKETNEISAAVVGDEVPRGLSVSLCQSR